MEYVDWGTLERNGVSCTGFSFSDYDKYHEEDVEDGLEKLLEIAPIKDGECNFTGEDDAHWRFVFRNGKWIEQSGRVVYEDY